MEVKELAKKVKELRSEQSKYFEYKKNGNVNTLQQLEKCKKLEKELDKTVEEILNPKIDKNQKSLFNN